MSDLLTGRGAWALALMVAQELGSEAVGRLRVLLQVRESVKNRLLMERQVQTVLLSHLGCPSARRMLDAGLGPISRDPSNPYDVSHEAAGGAIAAVFNPGPGERYMYVQGSAAAADVDGVYNGATELLVREILDGRPMVVGIGPWSRIARHPTRQNCVYDAMREVGTRYVVHSGGVFDMRRADSLDEFVRLSCDAAKDRSSNLRRLTNGALMRHAAGLWPWPRTAVPLGFRLLPSGVCVPDPGCAEPVERLFEMLADREVENGHVLRELGRDLQLAPPSATGLGYWAWRGHPDGHGRDWQGRTVADYSHPSSRVNSWVDSASLYLAGVYDVERRVPPGVVGEDPDELIGGLPVIPPDHPGGQPSVLVRSQLGLPPSGHWGREGLVLDAVRARVERALSRGYDPERVAGQASRNGVVVDLADRAVEPARRRASRELEHPLFRVDLVAPAGRHNHLTPTTRRRRGVLVPVLQLCQRTDEDRARPGVSLARGPLHGRVQGNRRLGRVLAAVEQSVLLGGVVRGLVEGVCERGGGVRLDGRAHYPRLAGTRAARGDTPEQLVLVREAELAAARQRRADTKRAYQFAVSKRADESVVDGLLEDQNAAAAEARNASARLGRAQEVAAAFARPPGTGFTTEGRMLADVLVALARAPRHVPRGFAQDFGAVLAGLVLEPLDGPDDSPGPEWPSATADGHSGPWLRWTCSVRVAAGGRVLLLGPFSGVVPALPLGRNGAGSRGQGRVDAQRGARRRRRPGGPTGPSTQARSTGQVRASVAAVAGTAEQARLEQADELALRFMTGGCTVVDLVDGNPALAERAGRAIRTGLERAGFTEQAAKVLAKCPVPLVREIAWARVTGAPDPAAPTGLADRVEVVYLDPDDPVPGTGAPAPWWAGRPRWDVSARAVAEAGGTMSRAALAEVLGLPVSEVVFGMAGPLGPPLLPAEGASCGRVPPCGQPACRRHGHVRLPRCAGCGDIVSLRVPVPETAPAHAVCPRCLLVPGLPGLVLPADYAAMTHQWYAELLPAYTPRVSRTRLARAEGRWSGRRSPASCPGLGATLAVVRAWARRRGYTVGVSGPLSWEVLEEYQRAHGEGGAESPDAA